MSNQNINNNNNYISFPNVYDTNNPEGNRNNKKLYLNSKSNEIAINQEIMMKNDLINIYSSKKYAKWFQILETRTNESGSYTIYKIAYRVSFINEEFFFFLKFYCF